MAKFQSFSGVAAQESEEIGFSLEGHDFPCLVTPPSTIWRDITDPMWAAQKVATFIEGCLAKESDIEVFRALIDSKTVIIPIETLRDIVMHLIEEYSSRPFPASVGSYNGQTPNGTGSTDAASPQGLTLVNSNSDES